MEDKNPLDGLFLKPDTKEEKTDFEDIKKNNNYMRPY